MRSFATTEEAVTITPILSVEDRWAAEFEAGQAAHVAECWKTVLVDDFMEEAAALEARIVKLEALMGRLQCAVPDRRLAAQRRRVHLMLSMAKSLYAETVGILLTEVL